MVTYEDGFLGKASEFGGGHQLDENDVLEFVMVMATTNSDYSPYMLENTDGRTRAGVLCQHN